jgi:hypothetical protein
MQPHGRIPLAWRGTSVALAVALLSASVAHAHDGDERPAHDPLPTVTTGSHQASPILLGPQTVLPPKRETRSPWPWVFMGVGALTLGTGIWLAYRDDHDTTAPCMALPNGRASCPLATSTQWQGWGFVAIGAELAVGGIVWRVVEARRLGRLERNISLVTGLGDLRLVGTF